MTYESAISELRQKWPVERIFNNCVFISNDLGEILQREFPDSEVYTARSDSLRGERVVFWANHQVSVVRQNGSGFVALDVTRPSYEEGHEYWMLRADSEEGLLRTLSEHYTGDWKLNQRYDAQNSRYIKLNEEKPKPNQ